VRYRVKASEQIKESGSRHQVITRHTNLILPKMDADLRIQEIYRLLANDEARNDMIFDDILQSLEDGRSPLLLTERTDHLAVLFERLKKFAKNVIVLRGGQGKKQRANIAEQMARISDMEERVIVATGRYIGEGFDDQRLDTLFLTSPISWKGTLQQYVGRLHRHHTGKKDVLVYDYADLKVPVLARMYQRRLAGYRAMGYEIIDSDSKKAK
jgi:superfamily II DNA or RNA helicase